MSYVVIGAGYGDEGKGLMVDHLVRQKRAQHVVRFNGGAQAGHTVVTDDGTRHVFSHVGSGHFVGAATVLGRRFIVNPLLLEQELVKLHDQTAHRVEIRAHRDAQVSTILDMMLNAEIETARGQLRHGSCGMGINETVTRAEAGFPLRFETVKGWSVGQLADELSWHATSWVPRRLSQLGLEARVRDGGGPLQKLLKRRDFERHAGLMMTGISAMALADVTHATGADVLEGAQGLALDEFMGEFPHVTRSLTGLPYALEAAADLGIREVTPLYVTRAYSTRHGAGPLPHEDGTFTDADVPRDTTNITNEWQGTLRYAPLDVLRLRTRIHCDLERSKILAHVLGVKVHPAELAITCLDHLGSTVTVQNHSPQTMPSADLPMYLQAQLGIMVRYTSRGRTSTHVTQHS